MSRKLATQIKDSAIPGKYKRVLEAYAAFANNDGTNIRPSQRQLGSKASTSRYTIFRNTPDLIASGILKQATSHTCKVKECNKGGTHFTGTWGRWTLVYEIDISQLQNAANYLAAKCDKVNVAKCRKVMVAKCNTTQVLNITPAPDGAGSTSNSSALTSGNKEVTKEPLLAPLVAEESSTAEEKPTDLPSEPETQNQEQPDLHPSVWSLQRIWKDRTGYLFTDEDLALANKLIVTYRYRVMEAVLRNTLWTRPESAKLRWNKFSVFAKNWVRNHEAYLAWFASNPKTTHAAVQKFDPVPEDDKIDTKEWNGLIRWMKEHGKIGYWTFEPTEWEKMGFTRGHVYTAMRYCGDEGFAVSKERFIDLLMEAAGVRAVGAPKGFDEEEA
jgi:hypothetical protein